MALIEEKMTLIEKVENVIRQTYHRGVEHEPDWIIMFAYWYGREKAAREYGELVQKHLAEQRKRAENCRYSNMAKSVIGDKKAIYFTDYNCDFTDTFGTDIYLEKSEWIPFIIDRPRDGTTILVSYGEKVFTDTFCYDPDLEKCYLKSSKIKVDRSMAWLPLPQPYKEENKNDY